MNRLALLLLIAVSFRMGVGAQAKNQIAPGFDPARVQALPHHHPQWATPANYAGPVAADLRLEQMTLVLSRSPQQEAAFEQFLTDQQNPASTSYHQWLTPAQVGERFGLSDQDIDTLTSWIQAQGLHVNWVSPSRVFIGFGGMAADIGQAFQTRLSRYNVGGVEHMSVDSDPIIPEELAPAIKAIHGLYTIEDKPAHHLTATQTASPQLSLSNGEHFITPGDFATIYTVPFGWSTEGSGQTIAILGRSHTDFADFSNFRTLTQTAFPNPNEIVPTTYGGVDPGPAYTGPPTTQVSIGDQSEATLDVQRAGSVSPGANLLLVVSSKASGGIEADAQYVVNTTPVPAEIMNISFGECESSAGQSGVDYWDTLFQQAAAEGISSFVSSGDSGASGCDEPFSTPPVSSQPNSPNYICSSSYATCVGGTEFNDASNSFSWLSNNNPNLSSAAGYIPEGAWNEPLNSTSAPQIASSGGGVSSFIATPSWQTGTGVPTARTGRYTPDVAFSASCHDEYFGCFAAGNGSCVAQPDGGLKFVGFCGTSAAAPSMAGISAQLNQQMGSAQGNLNQGLYLTAAASSYAFHDITVTTSGVTNCSVSTPSMCNNSAPSATGLSGGQAGYLVNTGYDEVTGLGSLNVFYFLNQFMAKITPTVTATPSAASITVLQGDSVNVTVTAPSGDPTPTGTVTMTGYGYPTASATLVNGSATFTISGGSAGVNTYILTVKYTPDTASASLYFSASTSTQVAVLLLKTTLAVTPATNTITTAQSLAVTVTVTGSGGAATPTGTVSLGAGNFGGTATLNNGSATFNIAAGLLAIGNVPLGAMYSPDAQSANLYSSSNFIGSVTVTAVAALTPTVTVTPGLANTVTANPLLVTVAVGGGSGNPMPSGAITLICASSYGIYTSTPTALTGGSASINIPAGSLVAGFTTITAVYAPDTASANKYNNTSGVGSVYVYNPAKAIPVISIFPAATSITQTQSDSINVVVTSSVGYLLASTGTITLSGGGYTSAPATLSTSQANFTIPAGTLAVGANVLTATYTPDAQSATYNYGATKTVTITVIPPSFTVAGTSFSVSPGATTGNTSTITLTPVGGFTGAVSLAATITSSPSGAQDSPTLTFSSGNPATISNTSSVTATLTVTTTGESTAHNRGTTPWPIGAGTALACLLFFGIPGRRRFRSILGLAMLATILVCGITACGGGGSSGATVIAGTTAGNYTVTVTGTSGSTTAQGTLTLTVG